MKFIKIIATIALLLILPLHSFGIEIRGTVISEGNYSRKISNAECSVLKRSDEATIIIDSTLSDDNGEFHLQVPDSLSTLILRIESFGYEPYEKEFAPGGDNIDVGECILQEVSTLDEVVVEGSPVVASDGKILYTPRQSSIEASTYAIELIGRLGIPTLMYNPTNRTLESSLGNPVILIDGHPSSQEELQSLKATDVLNVEYSPNVPAIYGEGNFLINVRLKKRDNGGSLNVTESNDFIGTLIWGGAGLRFHQGSSSWTLRGNFNYANNEKTYDTLTTDYTSPSLPVNINEESHSPFNYKIANATLQYNYLPSSSFLLSASYCFNNSNALRKSYTYYEEMYSANPDSYYGSSRTHNNAATHTLNFYLSKELNPGNAVDVNVVGTASSTPYESEISYDRPSGFLEYGNDIKSERYSLLAGLDYKHFFADRSQLGLCYLLTLSTNTNRYPLTTTESHMKENHNQIYAEYRATWANRVTMYLKSGLNIQHFAIDNRSMTYLNNLSQLNLQWVINPSWTLNHNLTYGSSPLSLGQLDDHLVQTSSYLYNNGNENLKPLHSIQERLVVSYSNNRNIIVNTTATYTRSINPAVTVVRYDDALKAYLSMPVNGRYSNEAGCVLQGSFYNILNMFSFHAFLEYRHYDFKDDAGWKTHTNSLGGFIRLTWQYRKWQIDYARQFPLNSCNGYVARRGPWYDQLSVRFTPNSHWDFQVGWSYMFDKKGWHYIEWQHSPEQTVRKTREMRNAHDLIQLTISYNLDFGSPFKKKERERVLNLNDNGSTFNDYGK